MKWALGEGEGGGGWPFCPRPLSPPSVFIRSSASSLPLHLLPATSSSSPPPAVLWTSGKATTAHGLRGGFRRLVSPCPVERISVLFPFLSPFSLRSRVHLGSVYITSLYFSPPFGRFLSRPLQPVSLLSDRAANCERGSKGSKGSGGERHKGGSRRWSGELIQELRLGGCPHCPPASCKAGVTLGVAGGGGGWGCGEGVGRKLLFLSAR